jgi:hypothetical protein
MKLGLKSLNVIKDGILLGILILEVECAVFLFSFSIRNEVRRSEHMAMTALLHEIAADQNQPEPDRNKLAWQVTID